MYIAGAPFPFCHHASHPSLIQLLQLPRTHMDLTHTLKLTHTLLAENEDRSRGKQQELKESGVVTCQRTDVLLVSN